MNLHSLVSCASISSLYAICAGQFAMEAVALRYIAISNAVSRRDMRFHQGGNSDKEVAQILPSSRLYPRISFIPQYKHSHNFGMTHLCYPQNSFHRR